MHNLPPTDPNGPVTDEQRAYVLDALNVTRDNLRQTLAGLSEAQLSYKSSGTPDRPERWSIAECVEHIALVESGIIAAIRKGMTYPANPDKRADIRVSDVDVIKAVRSRVVILPAPDLFVPTGRFDSTVAALQAFEQARETAIDYVVTLTDDLRTHFFRHPAFGWLDCYQAFLVLAFHPERHRKQIEEVKADAGFPQ